MKIKVYAVKSQYSNCCIYNAYDSTLEQIDDRQQQNGNTRISPIFEIDVPLLDDKIIVDYQVKAIDNIINQKEGKHFAEIQALKQRKQELLAITFQDSGNE